MQPSSGPVAGGTAVTITGTNFSSAPGATSVSFGSNASTTVSCASTTVCTATSPAAAAGTVDIIVTVDGSSSAANADDKFTYVALSTVPVAVPALAKGNGYWFVFTSTAGGSVSASWTTPARVKGTLSIYAGTPFAGRSDPVKLSPPAGALVTNSGQKTTFAATIVGQSAGTYTAYFFASGAVAASSASISYLK